MDLREQLLLEHTKKNTLAIVAWIGNSPARFNQLVQLLVHDPDYRVVQRAAWPLSYTAAQYPALLKKHLPALIKNLEKKNIHEAVKRNTLRLLQPIPLSEEQQGQVMNLCFNYIISPTEKPAIKAFSLQLLENMLSTYPAIGGELQTIIEEQWDRESAAFRSRARKVLKKIKD